MRLSYKLFLQVCIGHFVTSLSFMNNLKSWSNFHNLFRYGLLGFLLVNLAFFVSNNMIFRSIDAIAWLMILIFIEWPREKRFGTSIILSHSLIQITALGIISVSCGNSFIQEDWVSLANELTWMCVLLLPEDDYKRYKFLKSILYVSLAGYATYWGMNLAYMDCYDAILWIAAFLQLEYEKNGSSLLNEDVLYNEKIICA